MCVVWQYLIIAQMRASQRLSLVGMARKGGQNEFTSRKPAVCLIHLDSGIILQLEGAAISDGLSVLSAIWMKNGYLPFHSG